MDEYCVLYGLQSKEMSPILPLIPLCIVEGTREFLADYKTESRPEQTGNKPMTILFCFILWH